MEHRFRWDKALVVDLNLHIQTLQTLEPPVSNLSPMGSLLPQKFLM